MKKTVRLALAAALCLTGVFASQGDPLLVTESRETENIRLGKEAISQIRKDYKDGRFDAFLKEMDDSYEKVFENKELSNLAELRQRESLDLQWLESIKRLQNEKNDELLQLIQGEDSLFAEKVRSVALLEPQESFFFRFHQMQPGTGKNMDENILIALDLEYEYKMIHLDMLQTDFSLEKQYALKMEQADKMLLASQSFEDASLKSEVESFAQNIDQLLAKSYDKRDLHFMMIGKVKPTDKTQERVVSVLKEYQERMNDLYKSF